MRATADAPCFSGGSISTLKRLGAARYTARFQYYRARSNQAEGRAQEHARHESVGCRSQNQRFASALFVSNASPACSEWDAPYHCLNIHLCDNVLASNAGHKRAVAD